jgi:hypothetical protein
MRIPVKPAICSGDVGQLQKHLIAFFPLTPWSSFNPDPHKVADSF